jgi:hypothetical protein
MDKFWDAISKSYLQVGNARANGLGVICLTAILLVMLLALH